MAKKTSKTPIADPPTASSSSEEDDEDNDDDEEEVALTQTPITQKTFTKPIKETSDTKKTGSEPLPSSTKRISTSNQEPKESKRSKRKPGEEGSGSAAASVDLEDVKKKTGEEDEKKQLFQRLFSEDDEVVVLKGLLDYLQQNKVEYPFVNTNAFHDFVKDLIHTDVSKQQLMYKVRRLKKKFENNARRSKQGEDRIFTNPHEQKIFELSKKIWGKQGISGKHGNGNAKEEDRVEEVEFEMELTKRMGSLFDVKSGVGSLENEILKHGFEVVDGEKREAMEEKWRKLQVAELELFVQRKELIIEQAKLMLEVYKSEL